MPLAEMTIDAVALSTPSRTVSQPHALVSATQAPLEQTSPVLHDSASLHEIVLFV
jgi:hypothetical protein